VVLLKSAEYPSLCERALRSRLTLLEESQVELWVEAPNELSASATLANGDRECQRYFCESRVPVPETHSAIHFPAQNKASSVIAFCSHNPKDLAVIINLLVQ
jgi:hypothetical protein